MHEDIEIVNLVGSGDLQCEFDLQAIASDLDLPEARYDPEMNAVLIRFVEDGPLTILYRSGKYIIRGGNKREYLNRTNNEFLSALTDLGIAYEGPHFGVRNLVSVCDVGNEINLNRLMIDIGLENAEFEPEQFPGLVYHPPEYDCVVLIFASGKVVITGLNNEEEIEELYLELKEELLKKFN